MTEYVLTQTQLRYGFANLARYRAAMATVQKAFEARNMMLVAATVTSVGRINEVFNLWQVEDQAHHQRVIGSIPLDDPEIRAALAELTATIETEQVRFVETLTFGSSSHRP
jgi:hypothetical protein